MNQIYRKQVELLLSVMPEVAKEKCFALHGGTAINLFINDMPRLSVDIDLTYVPIEDRETSLINIHRALESIRKNIMRIIGAKVEHKKDIGKLIVSNKLAEIKIEVNLVGRGTLRLPEVLSISTKVQDAFDAFSEIQVVHIGQLYGGKICAALDRQHPEIFLI